VEAKVAIVYDWEARWGFDRSEGPDKRDDAYNRVCVEHYRPFWQAGISVDVIASTRDFSGYDLLITPQLWMLKPGVAERIRSFVEAGGTWVATLYTGYCDLANRCFLGGFPGEGLGEVLGIWNEEWDVLGDGVTRVARALPGNALGLTGLFEAREALEVIHARGAQVLAEYAEDYYARMPAITKNTFGKGRALYVAARFDETTLETFYRALSQRIGLKQNLRASLPLGVTVQRRIDLEREYFFLINFTPAPRTVDLEERVFESLLDGREVTGSLELSPFGSEVLTRSLASG
jgi:beta-galactosidase